MTLKVGSTSRHIKLSESPKSVRPIAMRILRESVAAQGSGNSPAVALSIRTAWSGWTGMDKLRLATTFAWLAGFLASRVDAPEREQLLTTLEEL